MSRGGRSVGPHGLTCNRSPGKLRFAKGGGGAGKTAAAIERRGMAGGARARERPPAPGNTMSGGLIHRPLNAERNSQEAARHQLCSGAAPTLAAGFSCLLRAKMMSVSSM